MCIFMKCCSLLQHLLWSSQSIAFSLSNSILLLRICLGFSNLCSTLFVSLCNTVVMHLLLSSHYHHHLLHSSFLFITHSHRNLKSTSSKAFLGCIGCHPKQTFPILIQLHQVLSSFTLGCSMYVGAFGYYRSAIVYYVCSAVAPFMSKLPSFHELQSSCFYSKLGIA